MSKPERRFSDEAFDRLSLDEEHDESELETVRQQYAELVRLRAEVAAFLEQHGGGLLARRHAKLAAWWDAMTHESYRAPPCRTVAWHYNDDDEAEEGVRLYGTEREWLDDLRREGKLLPWERDET